MLRRAFSDDPIDDHAPHPEKSLIKLAKLVGHPYLVMKFSFRENLVYGCIVRRPCFCAVGTKRALALCPFHTFWPLIKDRVRSGHLLFPTITRMNLNRITKAVIGSWPFQTRNATAVMPSGVVPLVNSRRLVLRGQWSLRLADGAPLAYSTTWTHPRTWKRTCLTSLPIRSSPNLRMSSLNPLHWARQSSKPL